MKMLLVALMPLAAIATGAPAAPPAQPAYLVQLTLKQGDTLVGSPRLLVAAGQPARAAATNADGARYDVTLSVSEREGSTYLVKLDLDSSAANGRSVHATPAMLVKAGETSALTVGPGDGPLSLALVVTPAGETASR